ncbi:RagB/SusD family nutrient uptake outer membrane protein [Chryseobacterium sp. H3056]|uniref:RagB/SusD family nutrient uptake outer membrane protein n=1 Tax=Kaistella daneshvariae TaxID=2487074 RepID=A0A3N0WY83_9FLAO|nr:RagB/SusD family nutrient uptake outer membrane protein [Kaistella daneshvariae]ROI10078.1 RagB/SusD family nutrient uptake outer membrane protein [Kaistella daneshvariae]
MKSLYKILPFLLIGAVQNLFISCEKLIEVDLPGNQLRSGQVFEDKQTANAAMAGLYASLFDYSVVSGDGSGVLLGSYTDDLDAYLMGSTNGAMDIYHNQQLSGNTDVARVWNSSYQQIYMANSIINGIDNSVTLEPEDKDQIKGEALLVRSLLFFYLQQLFGDLPYPTTTDYQINKTLSKSTSAEVLNMLESDLTDAGHLLKDGYRSQDRITPNRAAANLLLAKVLMLKRDWTTAEGLLKGILQNPNYKFENDITKVFDKNGKHILWQLKPLNPGDTTKEAVLYYFADASPGSYAISQNLLNVFSSEDLRKQNWMSPVIFNQNTYYRLEKYKNRIPGDNSSEYSVVFRLEEVYLLLAEALAQQNRVSEAVPFINATRQRAGLPALPDTMTKGECLAEALLEERKEFFAEMGHRFLDLKRNGNLDILTTVKPNWKNHHALWPVPQSDLLANPNLNPQNPGY